MIWLRRIIYILFDIIWTRYRKHRLLLPKAPQLSSISSGLGSLSSVFFFVKVFLFVESAHLIIICLFVISWWNTWAFASELIHSYTFEYLSFSCFKDPCITNFNFDYWRCIWWSFSSWFSWGRKKVAGLNDRSKMIPKVQYETVSLN